MRVICRSRGGAQSLAAPARQRGARMPGLLQMEEQDCGPTCLAMVLGHYGLYIPVHELRAQCGVSRDGVDAAALVRVARAHGLLASGRRVILPPDGAAGSPLAPLRALRLPAIILLRGPHFAILESVRGRRVRVSDPARGRLRMSAEDFRGSFAGVALVFAPGPGFLRGGDRWNLWRLLGRRVADMRSGLVFALLASVLSAVPVVVLSLLVKVFAENVLALQDRGWAVALCAMVAATAGVWAGCLWLQQLALAGLQTKLSVVSSTEFVTRLFRLPGEFFHRRQAGSLVTRVQANDIVAMLATRLITALAAAITMAFYLAVMLRFDPVLALAVTGMALLNFLALAAVGRWRASRSRLLGREQQLRDGVAVAGLGMIEQIKAEGAESALFARWAGHQARALNVSQRLEGATQALLVLPAALTTLSTITLVLVGGFEVMHDSLQLGSFLALLTLSAPFIAPVGNLVGVVADLQSATGQLALLEDVLAAEPDPGFDAPVFSENVGAPMRGMVEMSAVSFGYASGREPAIQDLSLQVKAGERVAVVGATGSGKSTVGRLITGLLKPWSGEILMDDVPLDEVPRAARVAGLAYVDQQSHLFEGTLADNLRFWDNTIADDRVAAAVDDALLSDVVAKRGGLQAGWVQEGGLNFSGGERQRLELARALAGDPAVLILDEATSALDAETEREIDARIKRRGCTVLLFAHRLSAVRYCDRIFVLDKGRLVQQGQHTELAGRGGTYRELFGARL